MIPPEVINEVKNRLIKTYDPLSIYLFGSYAWGSPTDESDLDLLIVVENSSEKSHKRSIVGYHALIGIGVSKDIKVYTKKEFEDRCDDQSSLVHKIKNQGKLLYVRA